MCLLKKAILFFLFFNVILLFIERISSLYRGYQWEKITEIKGKKLIFLYDLKKQ